MRCWIIKNGVPFDTAFSMTSSLLWSFWITFADFERMPDERWNYHTWNFNKSSKNQ